MAEILTAFIDDVETTYFWRGWENMHVKLANNAGPTLLPSAFVLHQEPDSQISWGDWRQFKDGIDAAYSEYIIKGVVL